MIWEALVNAAFAIDFSRPAYGSLGEAPGEPFYLQCESCRGGELTRGLSGGFPAQAGWQHGVLVLRYFCGCQDLQLHLSNMPVALTSSQVCGELVPNACPPPRWQGAPQTRPPVESESPCVPVLAPVKSGFNKLALLSMKTN